MQSICDAAEASKEREGARQRVPLLPSLPRPIPALTQLWPKFNSP